MIIEGLGGGTAILFREALSFVQAIALAPRYDKLPDILERFAWCQILSSTTLGGLLVGWLSWRFIPVRRVNGVADVVEANSLRDGNMDLKTGALAALSRAILISAGA